MDLLNSIFRVGFKVFFSLILLYFILLLFKIHYSPTIIAKNGDEVNTGVYEQLQFLKRKFKENEGANLQQTYPEGYVFFNVLYGLSWVDFIKEIDEKSDVYIEGLGEIESSITNLSSLDSKEIFDENLPLKYGVFYMGWTNYLLAQRLELSSDSAIDSIHLKLYEKNCDDISTAFENSEVPYLETYNGLTWPADNLVAVASLTQYESIFKSKKYNNQVSEWVVKVKRTLKNDTKLIGHFYDSNTLLYSESERGSSQGLILIMLAEIDFEFGKSQFEIYKDKFLDFRLGLPGIREYPKGKTGSGDIDSGPVIWGIGAAASIVGQKVFGIYGNAYIYSGLRNSIESFGLSIDVNNEKKYLFGKVPIADSFIAWSNSFENTKEKEIESYYFMKFSSIILLLVSMLVFTIFKI